jgi:3-oxoacyl-[acyl-carrier protein] reductase
VIDDKKSSPAHATPVDRRIAVVTGGTRGIGRAVVQRLAACGLDVHFTFVSQEQAAHALIESLREAGHSAEATRADSRDAKAVSAVVERVVAEHGRIDLLVNNAAITRDRLLARMSDDEWSSVLDTSLNGLFGASRPSAQQMMRQRAGRIINITSVSGVVGIVGQTNYCAAKAAIIGFTRSLAKELAPFGVSVNAVAPGFVDTDMLAPFTPEQRSAAVARVPMRRFGTVDEIAELVRYLGLDAPSYLTGQTLVVDGGMTC